MVEDKINTKKQKQNTLVTSLSNAINNHKCKNKFFFHNCNEKS